MAKANFVKKKKRLHMQSLCVTVLLWCIIFICLWRMVMTTMTAAVMFLKSGLVCSWDSQNCLMPCQSLQTSNYLKLYTIKNIVLSVFRTYFIILLIFEFNSFHYCHWNWQYLNSDCSFVAFIKIMCIASNKSI